MNPEIDLLAFAAVENLKAAGLTVTTAESCTGGMIAAALTEVPGASAAFRYGWVTYCNEAKERLLNVPAELIEEHTVVSEPVVAGLRAEDLYQVVGGVLRAGDRIHIYRVDEEGKAVLAWENVYVQGVFDQSGTAISNEDRNTAAQRINVYLDKKVVEEFYSQLNAGALRIVKREDV